MGKALKALFVLGAIASALFAVDLFLRHDLRGWTPDGDYNDPSTRVEAILPGGRTFSIADCVTGSVEPYGGPTPEEYSGTGPVEVLSCQSNSGAMTRSLSAAIFAAISGLLIWLGVRRRSAKI